MLLPYVALAALLFGFYLGWIACRKWHNSTIKKASDAVGSAAKKPGQVAKDTARKARSLFDRLFSNKDDKEKS